MPDDILDEGFTILIPNEGEETDEPDDEEDEFNLDDILEVANDIVPPDEDD